MTTVSAVATKVRIVTAASAIAAAATLVPAAVAYASPAAPLPEVGNLLGVVNVGPCNPVVDECATSKVGSATPGDGPLIANDGPLIANPPFVWFGSPANPKFVPLVGIVFPNFFGLDFEACLLGAAVHLSPYTGGFIGLGAGC